MNRFSRGFDELRDPWAIAMAEVTGGITYLIGAPVWIALASAASVLGVRIAAGLRFRPRRSTPTVTLTESEKRLAIKIVSGMSTRDIAHDMKEGVPTIRELRHRIFEKVGVEHRYQLRDWLIAEKIIRPVEPSWIRRIIESDAVKATLTAGGFIGLSWTLFQIYRTTCPGLQLNLPWLPLPPCPT